MNKILRFGLLPLLMLSVSIISCGQKTKKIIKAKNPVCLQQKIEEWKGQYCPKGKSVKQYTFQNKSVYVFEPGNCGADMQSIVLSTDCAVLGALGGFTGNMMINGEDFKSAVYVKTVWSN